MSYCDRGTSVLLYKLHILMKHHLLQNDSCNILIPLCKSVIIKNERFVTSFVSPDIQHFKKPGTSFHLPSDCTHIDFHHQLQTRFQQQLCVISVNGTV